MLLESFLVRALYDRRPPPAKLFNTMNLAVERGMGRCADTRGGFLGVLDHVGLDHLLLRRTTLRGGESRGLEETGYTPTRHRSPRRHAARLTCERVLRDGAFECGVVAR